MNEEEQSAYIRGIRTDIDILYQIPQVLKQVKLVCDVLPNGSKNREKIIRCVRQLRKDLINLDVVCQDIEWSMTSRNLKQHEKFFKNFSSNTQTANT
mgnify:CR=1 FL=1